METKTKIHAEDGKQDQRPHIGNEAGECAAEFVRKAVQRRVNPGGIIWRGTGCPKRLHQTPMHLPGTGTKW